VAEEDKLVAAMALVAPVGSGAGDLEAGLQEVVWAVAAMVMAAAVVTVAVVTKVAARAAARAATAVVVAAVVAAAEHRGRSHA